MRTRMIVFVSAETTRSQQLKTLIHEIAHAILHGTADYHTRAEMKVEAESVAFAVSNVLGLEIGPRSFCALIGEDAPGLELHGSVDVVEILVELGQGRVGRGWRIPILYSLLRCNRAS